MNWQHIVIVQNGSKVAVWLNGKFIYETATIGRSEKLRKKGKR